jgi:hypothetical protein
MSYTSGTLTTGLGITGTTTIGTTTSPSYLTDFRISSNDYNTYSGTITVSNNYMENNSTQPQQVKVVVFELEYNDDLKVTSTKFIDEFWVEQKPKADLKLAVAKKLVNKDVDLDKIVIRELFRASF